MSAEDQLRFVRRELRLIRQALERISPPPPKAPTTRGHADGRITVF